MMLTNDLSDTIAAVANGVARAYKVDVQDVTQEMWLWALEHEATVDKNIDEGNEWRVRRGLWGAGKRFALAERAERAGYSVNDLYFYDVQTITETLPYVLGFASPADAVLAKREVDQPALREDELATRMADVGTALYAVAPEDVAFLEYALTYEGDWDAVGEALDMRPQSARNRWNRIVKRIQKILGGASPWRGDRTGSRRVLSNATALNITRMETEGQ